MAEAKRTDENTIYVGNKPPMSYVLGAISRAVDTAEIVRNRFIKEATLKDIKIGTEAVTNEEGRTSNVSSIEIYLTKKKKKKSEKKKSN